jgi:hypothetical protein
MRVDRGAQAVVLGDRGATAQRVDHRVPRGEAGRVERSPGGGSALRARTVDEQQHVAAGRGDRPRRPFCRGGKVAHSGRVVEVVEDERAHRREAAPVEGGPQRRRLLGQVADRAELERPDARAGDLVEHLLPRRVAGRISEVDAPGHGAGGQPDHP